MALFVDTYDAIKRQLEGVAHDDSVRQPPFDGNWATWGLFKNNFVFCNSFPT